MGLKLHKLSALRSQQEDEIRRRRYDRRNCIIENEQFNQRKWLVEFTDQIQRRRINATEAFAPLEKYIKFLHQKRRESKENSDATQSSKIDIMRLLNNGFSMIHIDQLDSVIRPSRHDDDLTFVKIHQVLQLLHHVPKTSWNIQARETILHKAFSLKVFLEFLTPDSSYMIN